MVEERYITVTNGIRWLTASNPQYSNVHQYGGAT